MPKRLAGRALLFALGVLDAVGSLRNQVEPLRGYLFSADDASAVFAALEPLSGLVDRAEASLEHRLTCDVELPRFGLAGDIRGMLVGKCDLTAAVALRHGKALFDAFDGRSQVGTLALESLAYRVRVHLASVRQNCPVLPQDVSKQRSGLHLLDVREQDEWDAGHIAGAQHIPLGELGARLSEVPSEQVVVAVCRTGSRSDRAALGLRANGFKSENLDGGVTAWSRAGLPLVTAAGRPGRVI